MTIVTIVNRELYELIPILHEFASKSKRHILVYDDRDSSYAYRLQRYIKRLCKDVEMIELDEDSKKDMLSLQTQILKLDIKQVYLNGTNADSALLVILSGVILQHGGRVIAYDKFENSYNLISQNSFTNHKIENNLNLKSFAEAMGFEISTRESTIAKRYRTQINYIFKNSNRFFASEYMLKKKSIKRLEKPFKEALMGVGIIDSDYNLIRGKFGELFEYFIYLKLEKYDFDDIALGCSVLFDSELGVLNEFDMLAIKDNHIYAVECKLGGAFGSNEVIYKLDSIIEQFGEDARGLIVNIHPDRDHYNDDLFINKLFSATAHKRARFNNIEVYSDYIFNDRAFGEKIESFFDVKPKEYANLADEPLFLLGGADLEMLEIRKLLIKHNRHFIDKRLKWGAKLGSYKHLLADSITYYGIELIEDVPPPPNYIAIDHHNDMQEKKSSIEQIADILGVKLDRYQRLVALNDKGYIPAMVAYGATEVEVELIRERDREAQGVSRDDELLAEISIEESLRDADIVVVGARTEKFSPIADRLYGENILIYSEKKLNYYGRDVERLVKYYRDDIAKKRAYYGGGFGFFGLAEGRWSSSELKKEKKRILKILKK